MTCFYPITAWKLETQPKIVFSTRKGDKVLRELEIPCGQCDGCRLERSRQWSVRIMHEAKMHKFNCFITLTYDNDHLPENLSLKHEDFQLFMKRLRDKLDVPIRYYMCGEYGDNFGRPHFHACIFGTDFPDKTLWMKTGSGGNLFRSPLLESVWTKGFSSVAELTFESAAYVARYVMKKVTGDLAKTHYDKINVDTGEIYQVKPEYCKMSLKPGIGATFYDKYKTDIYPHDRVVVRGKECKPPRYYDKKKELEDPYIWYEIQHKRELSARDRYQDNTRERLVAKHEVLKAKIKRLKRTIK